jgi:hypothetical protein
VRSFTRAGVRRTRHKLGSFETGTGSSRRACAISMRSKGIAMRPRQCARCHSVTNRDRQAYETLALDHSGEIADDCARCGELAQAAPRGNFPNRRGANENWIQFLADGFARVRAQLFVSRQPPKTCMGVGEEPWRVTPIPPTRRSSLARKFRPHTNDALECAELAVGRQRLDGSKTRDRVRPRAMSTRARSLERLVFAACMATMDISDPSLGHTSAKCAALVHRACEQSAKHGCVEPCRSL